jgi:hypothetical protein
MDGSLDKLSDEVRRQGAYLQMRQATLDSELANAHALLVENAALDARLSDVRDQVLSGAITDERRLDDYLREADAQRQRQSSMRAVLRRVMAARRERDMAQREYERLQRVQDAAAREPNAPANG